MKKGIIYILLTSILLISVVSAQIEILSSTADNSIINLQPIEEQVQSFLSLTDTPNSYSTFGGSCVAVNIGETGLEFVSCSGGASGDITSVFGDEYITNGSSTGAVNLVFNETQLNKTIDDRSINGFSESDPIFLAENSSLWSEAKNKFNATYNGLVGNTSYLNNDTYNYNQTTPFTNWLSTFLFNYNETTAAINDINNRFWNRTQTYNITQIDSFNATWSSTFNSSYAGLIGNVSYLNNNTNMAFLNNTQTFTAQQNFSHNVTINQRTCYNADCSSYIFFNGTSLILQG